MQRTPERPETRRTRLASALGVLLFPLLSSCSGDLSIDFQDIARALQHTDDTNTVFDVCGEPPADSVAAQVPALGGEPVPGTFACGPSDEFIEARRANRKHNQPIMDRVPELSPPGIQAEGPSEEWIQGRVIQRNIVQLAEPGLSSPGPSHQWIEEHK